LKGHLGLSSALAASHLDNRQVNEAIRALKPVLNFRSLRPEHSYEIYLNPRTRRLEGLSYKLSPLVSIDLTRQENGTLQARRVEAPLEIKQVTLGGTVGTSLNRSMISAGGNAALVAKFVQLFSWDINWYVDPRRGDTFRIVAEKKYLNGKFYRFGRILAAEYEGKSGTKRAFYFAPSAGQAGYFTEDGRSIRRAFLKTPLSYRRVSSKYNLRRFHPVLKKRRPHNGVDYAAKRGTPIWAAADGWVVSASKSRGPGNMVVLKHGNGIVTLYMHLHRFASGMKRGKRVKQRQVIGYVGSTGLATGAHLHYGMKVKGRYVDPLKFKTPRGALLSSTDRTAFFSQLPEHKRQLEGLSAQ
jgi:murein DD-endopeptidase MepM/ murein hydrolase activator NlpD